MDIQIENHGSVFLFRPLTQTAKDWLSEHVHDGMYFGGALAVEHRYAGDLADGMVNDGLEVS